MLGRAHEAIVRAELLRAAGQQDQALRLCALGADFLKHKHAVIHAALLQLRLAKGLSARGKHAASVMKLAAAEAVFVAAGSSGYRA